MSATVDPATRRPKFRQWFPITVNLLCWALFVQLTFEPLGPLADPTWAIVTLPILYLLNFVAIFYVRTWLIRIPQLIFAVVGLPGAAIFGFITLFLLGPSVMP